MAKRLKKKFRIVRAITIAGIAAGAFSVPVLADDAKEANLDVYEISMTDTNPVSSLEARFLENKSDEGLNLINIDTASTKFDVENFDTTKTGFQKVHVDMTVVTTDDTQTSVASDYSEDVLVKMITSKAPQLLLTSGSVTVANSSEFNPNNYISYIGDISGNLPVLKINSNVDTANDGNYQVTYTAVNSLGISTEAKLNVTVAKTPEQLAAEQAEAEAAAEAERLAQEQAEQQAQAQALAAQQASLNINMSGSTGGANPYAGGWGNCTWGAWQACYNATGVSLPNFGNAYSWLYSAAASGYATGSSPAVGSIMVQSNHVSYVAGVSEDGSSVYVIEGNFNGHYNERWVPASGVQPDGQTVQGYIYVG